MPKIFSDILRKWKPEGRKAARHDCRTFIHDPQLDLDYCLPPWVWTFGHWCHRRVHCPMSRSLFLPVIRYLHLGEKKSSSIYSTLQFRSSIVWRQTRRKHMVTVDLNWF
ncbi:hypothetical protein HHX47_DHR1001321 [Lentinula edodes]|nr:hypothetical protein HHX47_DHR1001321 [Lentinula edodes]